MNKIIVLKAVQAGKISKAPGLRGKAAQPSIRAHPNMPVLIFYNLVDRRILKAVFLGGVGDFPAVFIEYAQSSAVCSYPHPAPAITKQRVYFIERQPAVVLIVQRKMI